MKRRSFFALALAPLARAIELQAPPQIIYRQPWTRKEEWDYDNATVTISETAEVWVHPRERECHARMYSLGYTLTKKQMVEYPTICAQMALALARHKRALERDLLAIPLDWHGELRRRDDTARSR